jgi:DNA-binding NarL/FixJ family response regulator
LGVTTQRLDAIPRRELVTLLAYVETGSHKQAAHRLGIAESTCRQRVSSLMGRIGAGNAAHAAWLLRDALHAESDANVDPAHKARWLTG